MTDQPESRLAPAFAWAGVIVLPVEFVLIALADGVLIATVVTLFTAVFAGGIGLSVLAYRGEIG